MCKTHHSWTTFWSSDEFRFFFRSCGVVCEAFYSIKNAQGSGRGSFAEGCPSRKVAEGDVGKGYNEGSAGRIWIWLSWCSLVSMSHIEYWNLILGWSVAKSLRFVGLITGFASVFCGSRAEASRKHCGRNTCPNNRKCPSPRQTNVPKEKGQNERKWRPKRPKWKEMKPTTTRNCQKPWKRSGAVVAEAKTKKTCSRKLAEGIYVKCVSRKLALWSRKHCGRCCGSDE